MKMLVLRSTHNKVVNENTALRQRNKQILPMVLNASVNLVPVFGRLESLGTDDTDEVLYFRAQDGLADVTLYPADGRIVVTDPSGSVDRVIVQLDQYGDLTAAELLEIRRFRADVLFTQQHGGLVAGRVSLVRRADSQ